VEPNRLPTPPPQPSHAAPLGVGESARGGPAYRHLFLAYLAFVLYGSIVPLRFQYVGPAEAVERFRHIRYFHLPVQSRADLVANFVLFVPLTFLAMGALRPVRRRTGALAGLAVAAAATGLSAAIEFVQIYFPQRTVSLNDILAETAGGIAGVALWLTLGRRITHWAADAWRARAGRQAAIRCLAGYLVGLILYQLFPFDLTISPAEVYHQFKEGKIDLVPFADRAGLSAYSVLAEVALMVPVGYLLWLWARPPRRWRAVAAGALGIAAAIEAAQLLVYSRYTSSTDIALATLGGLVGAALADVVGPVARRRPLASHFWARHGQHVLAAAALAWIAALAWQKWTPFDFAAPPGGLAQAATELFAVPFARQYFLPEAEALAQVARELVTFFILALLLRSVLTRPGSAAKAAPLGVAIAIAVVLEFGQVFLPTRTADPTAMAFGILGGIAGVWALPGFTRAFVRTPDRSPRPT